jgi:HlyD family secretion protein
LIQSTADGPIDKIEIQENQYVTAGEVIAYINDDELQSRRQQLQESIETLLAQIEQSGHLPLW